MGSQAAELYCYAGCPLDTQHICCHHDRRRRQIFATSAIFLLGLWAPFELAISHWG